MASKVRRKKGESKVGLAMREMKAGQLHSGSKAGPKVKNKKQALAIGLSEERKEQAGVPTRKSAKKDAGRRKRNIGRS